MQIEHKKNTAYYLAFPAVNSSSPASFATGLSPVDTAYYKDGAGAWTTLAITDTATEIGSTGVYEIDLTAAEMNHDQVIVKFAVSGMADTAFLLDTRTELAEDLGNGSGQVDLLTATQASIDAIEVDTNALNDTKIPNTLNTTATGNIGIDWANVENPTSVVDLSATDIQTVADGAITAAKIATNAITSSTLAFGAIDSNAIASGAITSNQLDATAATEIGNAVWAIPASTQQTLGTFGQTIGDIGGSGNSIYAAVVTNAAGTDIAADIIAVKTDTANTVADTNELQTDWANGGRLDVILDSRMAEASINTTAGAVDVVTTNTDMRGTDSAALATVCTEVRLAELDAANLPADVDAILLDTGTTIPASVAALNDLSAAEVNTEVADVLKVDTGTELGAVPAAAAPMQAQIQWIYMVHRNKIDSDATSTEIHDDAGVVVGTSTDSDDGSIFTRGEFA